MGNGQSGITRSSEVTTGTTGTLGQPLPPLEPMLTIDGYELIYTPSDMKKISTWDDARDSFENITKADTKQKCAQFCSEDDYCKGFAWRSGNSKQCVKMDYIDESGKSTGMDDMWSYKRTTDPTIPLDPEDVISVYKNTNIRHIIKQDTQSLKIKKMRERVNNLKKRLEMVSNNVGKEKMYNTNGILQ